MVPRARRSRGRACAPGAWLLVFLLAASCSPDAPPERGRADTRAKSSGASRDADGAGRKTRCPRAQRSYPAPPDDRPRYSLTLQVRPARRAVSGSLAVRFVPDLPTDRLVFRLWPNGPLQRKAGARLEARRVEVDGIRAATARPDPTTLEVVPEARLDPGQAVRATMRWRLRVPGPVLDRISARGSAVRLGSFFPILAWEPGRGWARQRPTTLLGETSSSPTADFRVRVDAPRDLQVVASGRRRGRVWRATAVRDFAVAIGRFHIAEGRVDAPRPIAVRVGVIEGLEASPEQFLASVRRALQDLSARFGPYPWDTFSLAVMPDLEGAGIEYPTMVFQGPESLMRATTHEVAHSWFYALVGNNQARDPWLDEGLTSWAQARGDGILDWYRRVPVPAAVRGRVGRPMSFWERHPDAYFAGVYAQSVRALASLGPPELVDCALRHYVARNAYGIARPRDLLSSLERVLPGAAGRLEAAGMIDTGGDR